MFDDRALDALRAILSRRVSIAIDAPHLRRACVLLPLIHAKDHWALLLTRRAENLAAHSGQIAFPGGGIEDGESLENAAIRETEEEVGIPRDAVELIGRLDDLVTNSGYLVAPFVGVIHEPTEYVIQQSEVVEVFEVPLDALLDQTTQTLDAIRAGIDSQSSSVNALVQQAQAGISRAGAESAE